MPQNRPPVIDDWAPVPSAGPGAEGADDWGPVPDTTHQAPATTALGRPSRITTGSYQGRRGGPILNASQSPTNAFAQAAERSLGVSRPPASLLDAINQSMKSTATFMEDTAKDPFTPFTGAASGLESAGEDVRMGIKRGDPRQVAAGTGTFTGVGGMLDAGAEDYPGYNEFRPREIAARAGRLDEGRGAIKPGLRLASQIGGGAAGGAAGLGLASGMEHGTSVFPALYGGRLGVSAGPPLAEAMFPKSRAPVRSGGSLPSAEEFYEHQGTDILKREKDQRLVDKMRAQEEKATAATRGKGGTQPSAEEFYERRGEDLMRRGREQEALDKKERLATAIDTGKKGGPGTGAAGGAGGAQKAGNAASTSTRARENLSPYMQRKIGEAEGRHDAGRMAATGAITGEDSRAGNVERRVNPGLRSATGPDPVRQSLVREAQKVIDDPKSTARDKSIAKAQIADIQAHPFEGAKGKDFVKEARSNKPRMSRKEAEAADVKRRGRGPGLGRNKRLAEEMGND